MINFKSIWVGLRIKAKAILNSDTKGELETLISDGKLYYHDGSTRAPLITTTSTDTLTNKTFTSPVISAPTGITASDVGLGNVDNTSDATKAAATVTLTNKTIDTATNTITGLTVTNLGAGVLDTDLTSVSLADDTIPSAKATKDYVDTRILTVNDASEITFTPDGDIAATNVQAAVVEVRDDTDTKLGNKVSTSVTINGQALTGNVTITATDVGLGNVDNTSDATKNAAVATLTNKTLTSPVINSPTGIVKGDVGLGNVDNTSDATKDAAVATLTNKTLTSPVINTPTGIVKGDVGLGNVDNTSDATKNAATVTLTNKIITGADIRTPLRLDMKQDTKANLVTYASTASSGQLVYATDTKETFVIKDSALSVVGGAGVGNVDTLSTDQADTSQLADYTQTNLEIVESPSLLLHGTKSFRLQHSTSIKSFQKIIAVDPKFRGKNVTLTLDVMSTATSGNLNILIEDETNSTVLAASQPIPTNSQAITASAVSTATLSGMDNATFNLLKVGMLITGANIPVGTTITALNTGALTATMSAASTGTASTIRISALSTKQSFSFDIPNNTTSISWTISSVVEANVESYIDDVVIQLTSVALSSTSVTVPKNNDTEWTPATFSTLAWQGLGTVTNNSLQVRRASGNLQMRGRFTTGTTTASVVQIPLPNNFGSITSATNIGVNEISNTLVRAVATANALGTIILQPSSSFFNIGGTNFLGGSVAGTTPATGTSSFGSSEAEEIGLVNIPIAGWLSNETESVTIPLTTSQLVQSSDSIIRLNTLGSGTASFGSTNTAILRFVNIAESLGSDVQYQDSASLGASFTILTEGMYDISFSTALDAAVSFGISKNSTQLTTDILNITVSDRLAHSSLASSTTDGCASTSAYLKVGDIIRPHATPSTQVTVRNARSEFTISKQGSLKQLNVSSDSKITIPTHQLRFDGSSSRGTGANTGIVKFDSQTITQGDAWSVVNDSTFGTVITMQKAGRLNVSGSVYSISSSSRFGVSKNQTVLTGAPTVQSELVSVDYLNATNSFYVLSGTVDVVIGDKIRVFGEASTTNATIANVFSLFLTETSIAANFSNVLPQWSQSDSTVQLNTGNGNGSTNTAIPRFSNTTQNIGSDITYVDSATLGSSFTTNTAGIYNISFNHTYNTSGTFGISKNSVNLTTAAISLPVSEILALSSTPAANLPGNVSWQGYLDANTVIRPHASTTPAGDTPARHEFTISKVGKPNLTSVDVTPFVNMKTTDTEAIECLTASATMGSTNTSVSAIGITSNTNRGIIQVTTNSIDGTSFKALKDCIFDISVSANMTTVGNVIGITRNSTNLTTGYTNDVMKQLSVQANGYSQSMSASIKLNTNDIIRIQRSTNAVGMEVERVTITAVADNNATASPTQQVSSDTMSFVFKSTVIDPAVDAIGTFNTYTYAINTNTQTISASAPTQTVSDMNVNGIQIFPRAYNAASTSALPSKVDIFIGKGLKSKQVDAYVSAANVNSVFYDIVYDGAGSEYGTAVAYDSTKGILSIDIGRAHTSAVVARYTGYDSTGAAVTGGTYFTINASKSPSLVSLSKTVADGRVISTAGTSIANSGDVKVVWDSAATFLNGLNFDSTNNRFIAGYNGEFQVFSAIQFQSALYAAGNLIELKIYKNGVYYSTIGHKSIMAALTVGEGTNGADIVRLSQNEYIEIYVANNRTAGATSLTTTAGNNYFAVSKIGALS